VAAVAIVTRKNPVHSVLLMLPFFLSLAAILVMLQAPCLAAMLVIVYGGAILVVFLFVIMLINLRPEELKSDASVTGHLLSAVLAGLLAALVLSFVLIGIPPGSALEKAFAGPIAAPGSQPEFGSLGSLSLPLFKQYLIPFELVSLLIVAAILGVVLLGKKKL
jgi:NADH-quinone oxidoreductase subunit J